MWTMSYHGHWNGPTVADNLALACVTCSLRKAARTNAIDSTTGEDTVLFSPRTHLWNDHFEFTEIWSIHGQTPMGRATVDTLGMNRRAIILIRQELVLLGRFPGGKQSEH